MLPLSFMHAFYLTLITFIGLDYVQRTERYRGRGRVYVEKFEFEQQEEKRDVVNTPLQGGLTVFVDVAVFCVCLPVSFA